jgi:hypothetical protein
VNLSTLLSTFMIKYAFHLLFIHTFHYIVAKL